MTNNGIYIIRVSSSFILGWGWGGGGAHGSRPRNILGGGGGGEVGSVWGGGGGGVELCGGKLPLPPPSLDETLIMCITFS